MLNRRKFIRASLLSIGMFALADFAYSVAGNRLPEAIHEILVSDLKGLSYNPADIRAFAKEVAEKNALGMKFTHVQLLMLYHRKPKQFIPGSFYRRYQQLRDGIVSKFLLSTDFFYNKMNPAMPVTYLGSVYKPYETACINPFSGMYYKS